MEEEWDDGREGDGCGVSLEEGEKRRLKKEEKAVLGEAAELRRRRLGETAVKQGRWKRMKNEKMMITIMLCKE